VANVNIVTGKPHDSAIVCSPQWRFVLIMARTFRRLVAPKMMMVCGSVLRVMVNQYTV